MDSALESWDSSGLEGNNMKANQRKHLKEPNPSDGNCNDLLDLTLFLYILKSFKNYKLLLPEVVAF